MSAPTKEQEALKKALEALTIAAFGQLGDGTYLDKNCQVTMAIAPINEALAQTEKELVVGTKTWFEGGKVVTQNLTAKEIYKDDLVQEPMGYAHWEERIKSLMQQVGMPNSISLAQAMKQLVNEITQASTAPLPVQEPLTLTRDQVMLMARQAGFNSGYARHDIGDGNNGFPFVIPRRSSKDILPELEKLVNAAYSAGWGRVDPAKMQDSELAPLPAQEQRPSFTTGHCKEKRKPGGCQLHNIHCGFPACDRKES